METYTFYGSGKPCYSIKNCLKDYKGAYAQFCNCSDMSHDSFVKAVKRHFADTNVCVVSRNKIVYLNTPIRSIRRAPGVLYFEGDWNKTLKTVPLNRVQQVVNLTDSYKRNCDFVKQLGLALITYEIDGYEAVAERGCCILRRVNYA